MGSFIGGILRLTVDAMRASTGIQDLELRDLATLSPRSRRAIRALMDYPQESQGWVAPKHLYQKKVCGYNKTSETWQELALLELIEVSKKKIHAHGRTTSPTRIRLATTKRAIIGIFSMLAAHEEFRDLLVDMHTTPPQYYIDNKTIIQQTIKEAVTRTKKLEVIGKKKGKPAKK